MNNEQYICFSHPFHDIRITYSTFDCTNYNLAVFYDTVHMACARTAFACWQRTWLRQAKKLHWIAPHSFRRHVQFQVVMDAAHKRRRDGWTWKRNGLQQGVHDNILRAASDLFLLIVIVCSPDGVRQNLSQLEVGLAWMDAWKVFWFLSCYFFAL